MKREIREAIEEYNRYRGAEARAEIRRLEGDTLEVRITGPFCETCGYYDWAEDLEIILNEKGLKARIKGMREIEYGLDVVIKIGGD